MSACPYSPCERAAGHEGVHALTDTLGATVWDTPDTDPRDVQ